MRTVSEENGDDSSNDERDNSVNEIVMKVKEMSKMV